MRRKRTELSRSDRQTIHVMRSKGKGIREIFRIVCRSPSVVSRELKRRHLYPMTWLSMTPVERGSWSYEESKRLRSRVGSRFRLRTPEIRSYVIRRLRDDNWTPEEIARRLPQELEGGSISARAIYYFIEQERRDLAVCLPERGAERRRSQGKRQRKEREEAIPKRLIEERPAAVLLREEYGHWEADTIVSKRGGRGGVVSLVERGSRYGIYRIVPNLEAETVLAALRACYRDIPRDLCKSLTIDNGSEFTYSVLRQLEEELSMPIYYCHPYCAHERGTVERRNRNIRWYYPKGTDFSTCPQWELQRAVAKIHNRPMKVLGYESSKEVWQRIIAPYHSPLACAA